MEYCSDKRFNTPFLFYLGAILYNPAAIKVKSILGTQTAINGGKWPPTANIVANRIKRINVKLIPSPNPIWSPIPPLTFLDESEQTKMRAPGDLLGVQAKFNVKLSDYGVNNKIVGQKVSENIDVNVNIVGSNAK